MLAWGLGVGFVIALGESRLLKAFLFGVGPSDPKTMVFVAALLSAVALTACSALSRKHKPTRSPGRTPRRPSSTAACRARPASSR